MLKNAIEIYSQRPDLAARTAKAAFALAEVESVLGEVDEEITAKKAGNICLAKLCFRLGRNIELSDLDSLVPYWHK